MEKIPATARFRLVLWFKPAQEKAPKKPKDVNQLAKIILNKVKQEEKRRK